MQAMKNKNEPPGSSPKRRFEGIPRGPKNTRRAHTQAYRSPSEIDATTSAAPAKSVSARAHATRYRARRWWCVRCGSKECDIFFSGILILNYRFFSSLILLFTLSTIYCASL